MMRNWTIRKTSFQAERINHLETLFTIGNGYLGVRGSFEEGLSGEMSTTFVHGFFNQHSDKHVTELVNFPNWLTLNIKVDGETFRLDQGIVLGYEHVLDLYQATLRRGLLWRSPTGALIRLRFERFASLDQPHILALRFEIIPLDAAHTVSVESILDGSTNTEGRYHWAYLAGKACADGCTQMTGKTSQSGYMMAMASQTYIEKGPEASWSSIVRNQQYGTSATWQLAAGQALCLVKLTALHTNRDWEVCDTPLHAAQTSLKTARSQGFDKLHEAHKAQWAADWQQADIEIEGDDFAQLAVRFSTYHILIATPRADEQVSIGAKTLSGYGYKGHVFWDTDLFIVPYLTVTRPRLARNLLMYRYHKLAGARDKAHDNGYEGAMYPWESADTGEECTPRWGNPLPDGTRIRIWTGDNEIHLLSDIAYAVLHYWRWTGDNAFISDYGAEIVLDTAVFWGSRAEYKAEHKRYEYNMVIGPDEYHENVNNSVFTNRMAQWHLQSALDLLGWLETTQLDKAIELRAALDLSGERLAHWRDVIAKMYIPFDAERGVFEQFDGFFDLEEVDVSVYQPREKLMCDILGHERVQKVQVIKQADVVMLIGLLGEALAPVADLCRNWDIYAPRCDHGSSLSPVIHSLVASRLGMQGEAYRLFDLAAGIDLADNKGNARNGIHAATAGGLLQAVLFGFAGLQLRNGDLIVNPQLPEHWRRLRFSVRHQAASYTITISQGEEISIEKEILPIKESKRTVETKSGGNLSA